MTAYQRISLWFNDGADSATRHRLFKIKLNYTGYGFISFVKQFDKTQSNANIMHLFETVCKYSQRDNKCTYGQNNPQLLISAIWMTKELFHGGIILGTRK